MKDFDGVGEASDQEDRRPLDQRKIGEGAITLPVAVTFDLGGRRYVRCPRCGDVHEVPMSDGYIVGICTDSVSWR